MKKRCGFAVAPYKGINHWKYKGGVTHVNGYKAIKVPDHPYAPGTGYILEHRLVIEKQLGRYLLPNEKVHHINGDITNNSPENLVVLTHREHLRKHMCKKGANHSLLENKEWLASQHAKGLNTNQIASLIGCAAHAVRHSLDRFGIKKIVSVNGHIPQSFPELRNPAWLREKTNSMSQREIAKLLGCNCRLVYQFQKKHGIKSTHKPPGRKPLSH